MVSIVSDTSFDSMDKADTFTATYKKFKTKTNYEWQFDRHAEDANEQLKKIASEVKQRADTGAIFLATDAISAARLVKYIRDAGGRNYIFGISGLASDLFRSTLADMLTDESGNSSTKSLDDYMDGLTLTSPVMFDTANEVMQSFKNGFIDQYKVSPDWIAANTNETAKIVGEAIQKILKKGDVADQKQLRSGVRDHLASLKLYGAESKRKDNISYFDGHGEANKAVFIGNYVGDTMVSSLTQLQPIRSGVKNYIAEYRSGRVLFVNDRFMYKTNVVYTGISINDISEVNLEDQTAQIDFGLWFRFKGDFNPEDIVFQNNAEDITLGEPVEDEKQGDMTYRFYRVQGKFFMNFGEKIPAYGQYQVGVSFSHKKLNKNNLQYVVDFLGLGLASGKTFEESLNESRALNPAMGWLISRAWLSQDIKSRSILGSPKYVGHGAATPDYSTIEAGIVIQRDEFAFKNLVSPEYFVYLAIFGLLGVLFAQGMDGRKKEGFWNFHSWMLRLLTWPILLLACGNIALDFSAQNLSVYYTDLLALIYQSLWWIMPARLIGLAVERFIWQPLEAHTKRMIPNVVRAFASMVIYTFAILGIVAFVMGQTLTSLLATSGVLAMVVGLAIQANIANVFSGIILNIERPFQVGDFIMVDGVFGKVVDITWRTVRIESYEGPVVSMTNAKVSESKVENHNQVPKGLRFMYTFHVTADVDPEEIQQLVKDIIDDADYVLGKDNPRGAHQLLFTGIESVNGQWVAGYQLMFKVKNFLQKIAARGAFSLSLREKLLEKEIPLLPAENGRSITAVNSVGEGSGGGSSVLG